MKIQIEEAVGEDGDVKGCRITCGEHSVLVYEDQERTPGFRSGAYFVPGIRGEDGAERIEYGDMVAYEGGGRTVNLRSRLKKLATDIDYYSSVESCKCDSERPIGGCMRCDMLAGVTAVLDALYGTDREGRPHD